MRRKTRDESKKNLHFNVEKSIMKNDFLKINGNL